MSVKGSITTADCLHFEDYQRLVQSLIDEKQYWWACYCILSFCTGLRFSDVSRLTWKQILGQKKLTISAQKTGKTHQIPIGQNASQHFEDLYEKMGKPNVNSYVLHRNSESGKSVTSQYINRTLKTWIKKYNLDIENFSTHTFRKTFGRYVYEKNGRDDKALMYLNRIFKHANLNTTLVYLGIRNEEIASIFNSIEI